MSPRAPKKCGKTGCETRVIGRAYCDEHTPEHGWTKGGMPRTGTAEHRRWRDAVLKRDNYQCQIRYQRCTGRADTADHIVAVKLGGAEFDVANGRASCTPCNQLKASYEGHEAQRRRR